MSREAALRILASLAIALPVAASAQTAAKTPDTWTFTYPDDTRPGCLLDLRGLNETKAGQTGFVKISPDGRGFVRGDGRPIRFWPVCGYGYRLSPAQMDSDARFLAKMGVNMVRIHASISPKGKGKAVTDYDADEIDHIQRYVAALEKQGIYATISPFWANGPAAGAAASWGLGYGDGEDIWGLLFFNPQLQEGYKTWMRKLYKSVNPYTGVPLAKDPAVAIVQVQNEDGLFFWTFQGIKPAQKRLLAAKFGQWLKANYGSLDAARSRWAGAEQKGDDWAAGVPALMDTWFLTQPQTGGTKARLDDETAFLIDFQKGFYAGMDRFIHDDLGYPGLVNASNWITADPVRLNDAERYTYSPTDVFAVNRYYDGGVHLGPNAGWRIDQNDFFSDTSALLAPRLFPFNLKQTVGHPMVITESAWVLPLEYQTEGPLLAASYESLSGVQGLYWFELGAEKYDADSTFNFATFPDGSHPLSKWTQSVPQTLGQFPATALLYRQGDVAPGPTVVHEERTRAMLNQREIPLIAEDPSFDPNHYGSDSRAGSSQASAVDPLAFLVGRVEEKFDGDPSRTRILNVSPFIDHAAKTVRSATGQLSLDYGNGFFTVDSPKAQGFAGFVAKVGGQVKLHDISIQTSNPYATVVVVSMDGLPIAKSKKLLVQIGTIARPAGWKQSPGTHASQDGKSTLQGFKVDSPGKMPWEIEKFYGTVTVSNRNLSDATVLDPAGYLWKHAPTRKTETGLTVSLPANALYVILD